MNDREAYEKLGARLGVSPEIIPYMAEVFLDHTIINPVLPETMSLLGRLLDLKPGKKVLDLACGKGGVSLPLVYTYKVNLTGIDLLPDFIREAWSRAEYTGLYEYCDFKLDDAAKFVAETRNKWDAVLVVGAMSIIWPGVEEGAKAVLPLIAPGGFLVVGEPYLKEGRTSLSEEPMKLKEEITGLLEKNGRVVEILDDGEAGWKAYIEPQIKTIARLKEDNPDKPELMEFLNVWAQHHEWEKENLGYAVWVVKID